MPKPVDNVNVYLTVSTQALQVRDLMTHLIMIGQRGNILPLPIYNLIK